MKKNRGLPAAVLIGVVIVVGLAVLVLALLAYQPPVEPTPVPEQPTPVPTPLPDDTGWHMAIDVYGDTYFAMSRYDEAPDWVKDDMNRFARLNPDGGYDPSSGPK